MTALSDHASTIRNGPPRFGPTFLIYLHTILCCLSFVYVLHFYGYILLQGAGSRGGHFYAAALSVAPFALVSILFTFGRFSFGYAIGFCFYTIILGYLWLLEYSTFRYDHALAYSSAFLSGLLFLLPALLITAPPITQRIVLSPTAFIKLLSGILMLASIVVAVGAFFNLRLIGLSKIYSFRNEVSFPLWLLYAMGITSNALLPFAFACFIALKKYWRAAVALLLLLVFYPITLSKLALFASGWLLFLTLASRFFEARTAVVLSLFIPILVGVVLEVLLESQAISYSHFIGYFGIVNFRMIAVPSSALDFYNDFFWRHHLTYFCQIHFLKALIGCPYREPLSVVMQNAYQAGNFNASLLATEGIASVGLTLAPIAVLGCGLLVALGNRLSSDLPPRFILQSSGVLLQTLMNVPLTVAMVSYGGAVLFLLWYITPRSLFEPEANQEKWHGRQVSPKRMSRDPGSKGPVFARHRAIPRICPSHATLWAAAKRRGHHRILGVRQVLSESYRTTASQSDVS